MVRINMEVAKRCNERLVVYESEEHLMYCQLLLCRVNYASKGMDALFMSLAELSQIYTVFARQRHAGENTLESARHQGARIRERSELKEVDLDARLPHAGGAFP